MSEIIEIENIATEVIAVDTDVIEVIEIDSTEVITIEGIGLQGPSGDGVSVTSFKTRTGAITPQLDDYQTSLVTNDSIVPGATDKDALDYLYNNIPTGFVTSFNARGGDIIPLIGDYDNDIINNTSLVSGVTTKDALNTINTDQGTQDTNISTNANNIGINDGRLDQIDLDQTAQDVLIGDNATDISTIQAEQIVQDNAIALNTAKRSYPLADENRLANTSGTNTGDQDISGIAINASDIDDLQAEQIVQDGRIGTNETDIANIQAEQITQNNNIASNTSEIGTLLVGNYTLGNNVGQDLSLLDTQVKSNADAISGLPGGFVTSFDGRTGAVNPILDDYQTSLITNDSLVVGATTKDALNTLDAENNAQDILIQANTDDATALEIRVSDNETDISVIQGEQTTQDARLDAIETEQITQNNDILANTNEIGTLLAGNYILGANVGQDLGLLDTQVKANDDNITTIQGEQVTQNADILANTSAINLLDLRVGDNEDDILVLQGQVSGLPSTFVESFKSRIGAVVPVSDDYQASLITNDSTETGTTVKDALDNLDLEQASQDLAIGTNASDITALDGRVTTNEGDIVTIQGEQTVQDGLIQDNADAITAIDGRVTTNEGDILTIQGEQTTQDGLIQDNSDAIAVVNGTAVFQSPISPNPINYLWLGNQFQYDLIGLNGGTYENNTIYNVNNSLESPFWFYTKNVSPVTPVLQGVIPDSRSVGSNEGTILSNGSPSYSYTDSSVEHLVQFENFDPLDVTQVLLNSDGVTSLKIDEFVNITGRIQVSSCADLVGEVVLPIAPNSTQAVLTSNPQVTAYTNSETLTGQTLIQILNNSSLTSFLTPPSTVLTSLTAYSCTSLTTAGDLSTQTSLTSVRLDSGNLTDSDQVYIDRNTAVQSSGEIRTDGGTNAIVTASSSTARADLLGRGVTLTFNS